MSGQARGALPLRGTVGGRAILEARVIQVENVAEAADYPVARAAAQRFGYGTTLSVPLLREGIAIGAITMRRTEVLSFRRETDRTPPDLRRPGRDRHRERAPVQRAAGEEPCVDARTCTGSHGRRRLVHLNVTEHPTAEWTARQLLEACGLEESPRYLIRDRDKVYGERLSSQARMLDIREAVITPRSPWQNAYAERVIGSIRFDGNALTMSW